jgi:thiol:disulfide interchange protein
MQFDDKDQPKYSRYIRRSSAQQKRLVLYAVLLVVVVGVMLTLRGKAHRRIEWVASFQEAQALAQAQGKPILAYFYADNSDDCRRMDQETFADRGVIAESQLFVCVRINGPANAELAKSSLAVAYPSVAFIAPGGERLPVVINYRTPDQMLEWMQDAVRRWRLSTLTDADALPPKNADPSRGEAR